MITLNIAWSVAFDFVKEHGFAYETSTFVFFDYVENFTLVTKKFILRNICYIMRNLSQ